MSLMSHDKEMMRFKFLHQQPAHGDVLFSSELIQHNIVLFYFDNGAVYCTLRFRSVFTETAYVVC